MADGLSVHIPSISNLRSSFGLRQKFARDTTIVLIDIRVLFCQLGLFRVGIPAQLAVKVDLPQHDEEKDEAGQAAIDCQVLDIVGHLKLCSQAHHRGEGQVRLGAVSWQRCIVDD